MTGHTWIISVRPEWDNRIHSFHVRAEDEDDAIGTWVLTHGSKFSVDDIVKIQRKDLIVTR
jgi:hypothetical protein